MSNNMSSSPKTRKMKTSPQTSADSEPEKSEIQFLLTEFQEMGQFWRHTDARIETAINFYLTVVALFIPGVFLLYQQVVDLNLFILMSIPICIALIIVGYFLASRITSADILKAKYVFSMNLIRGYFVEKFPHIARNLHMPISLPTKTDTSYRPSPVFHRSIITISNVINSVLFGLVISEVAWILFEKIISLIQIIFIGGIGALICFVLLARHYKKIFNSFQNKEKGKGSRATV